MKRKADEYARLKNDTQEAKKDRKRRAGSKYQPGIGMTGGYDEEEQDDRKPAAKKRSKPTKKGEEPKCSSCGEAGHWRPSNRLCKNYAPRGQQKKMGASKIPAASAEDAEAQQMQDELEQLEAMPIQDDESDAFFSAASDFSDTLASVI